MQDGDLFRVSNGGMVTFRDDDLNDQASRLRRMLMVGTSGEELDGGDSLVVRFAQQWNAPRLKAWFHGVPGAGNTSFQVGSFLCADEPSRQGLMRIKEFYKTHAHQSFDSLVPRELATALYYIVLAAAWGKGRRNLSRLSPSELCCGWEWALDQEWVNEESKVILRTALRTN